MNNELYIYIMDLLNKDIDKENINNLIIKKHLPEIESYFSNKSNVNPQLNIEQINKLKKPLHLIFSYDEEIGCVGIQKLIPFLKKIKPKPAFCIVGEPTEMKLVNMHKGKKNFVVLFKGIESHSSLTENGVNAIDYCGELINYLKNFFL